MRVKAPSHDLVPPGKLRSKRGLPAIVDPRARILIIGTLPGEESLRRQEYYGHPRNHFWPLIAALAGAEPPAAYADRVSLLKRCGFALWDVLLSAERIGSLDSAIRNARPNRFAPLFRDYPDIATIAFNGQKAHALFRQHVAHDRSTAKRDLRLLVLPSTSPTYVRPFEEKLAAWRGALLQEFRAK
jgi:TDG/mug DNA glycosylase family protein